jgi:hypothetical protein
MRVLLLLISVFFADKAFSQIIVSEIYGASANAGYNNDFVEIKNIGATTIDISGTRVYYASQNGSSWSLVGAAIPANTSILPGGSFVFCGAAGGASGSSSNCAVTNGTTMSATNGKVALVLNAGAAPTGTCPASAIPYGALGTCPNPGAPGHSNITSSQYDGSTWTTASPNPMTVSLPIDLVSFEARKASNHIAFNFTTASESNNSHFEIERSSDSRNFSKIGEVRGAGTTNQTQNYQFIDEKPLTGINYYRLKQVDFDGTSELSKMITVRFGHTKSIHVVPTLVTDLINVELSESANDQDGTWQVFDINGRLVASGIISTDAPQFTADLSQIELGLYLLHVQFGTEVITERIQKL